VLFVFPRRGRCSLRPLTASRITGDAASPVTQHAITPRMGRSGRGIDHHQQQTTIGTNIMAKSSDEILVNTYGTNAPDAAKFGKGATNLAQINEATEARRAQSDSSKKRQYER
jgi:hypothetical protein